MQMTRISQMKKNRYGKILYTMIPLINVRTVCILRKWHVMSQMTVLLSRIKSQIKIFIIIAILCFFGGINSINTPKSTNTKNLKSRLYTANCSYIFFSGATSKHFHHYICPTLSGKDAITDIAVLHMATNDIMNSENNKDLVADSIINTARECVPFVAKNILISTFDAIRNLLVQ